MGQALAVRSGVGEPPKSGSFGGGEDEPTIEELQGRAGQLRVVGEHKAKECFSTGRGKDNVPALARELAEHHLLNGPSTLPWAL